MVTRRVAFACLLLGACAAAQNGRWSQRGFLENRTLIYPQDGEKDKTRLIDEMFLRYEFSVRLADHWSATAGMDAQTDTNHQVVNQATPSWDDREIQRPALALRTALLRYTRGPFRIEAGKQVLRWGVMDLFSPTDRLAPHDYLSPSGSDYLGTWAARAVVDTGRHGLELIWSPRFTPSRAPLADQRWVMLPPLARLFTYRFRGVEYPGGGQFAARYHQLRRTVEYSFCFYEGFENLPSLPTETNFVRRIVDYRAVYPKTRMVGTDLVVPWQGLLLKSEAAYMMSPSAYGHDVWTYTVQAEKTWDKLYLAGGYSGELVTDDRNFAALAIDRGLRKSFHGRAAWVPSARHNLTADWYLRQTGSAFVTRVIYSRKLAPSLRASVGWNWIGGRADDPIGRYGRNSFLCLQFRYSF